jgi:hypothetical protein
MKLIKGSLPIFKKLPEKCAGFLRYKKMECTCKFTLLGLEKMK